MTWRVVRARDGQVMRISEHRTNPWIGHRNKSNIMYDEQVLVWTDNLRITVDEVSIYISQKEKP